MNTRLLKLCRKHPITFEVLYGSAVRERGNQRAIRNLTKKAKQLADMYWGWDIDREAYDTCIIAAHILQEHANRIDYELD